MNQVDGSVVRVDGCDIVYRRLGVADRPCIVLLHGARAHGGWWTRTAQLLARHFDVLVPDLSGHGDSGHRRSYGGGVWAAEVAAVLADARRTAATVVGHSMGGKVAITAATATGNVDAVIVVDTDVCEPVSGPLFTGPLDEDASRRRIYATRDEAVARFRLAPGATSASQTALGELAAASVTAADGGWTWKFDPGVRRMFTYPELDHRLATIRCPMGVVRGEHSPLMTVESVNHVERITGRVIPAVVVPGAHHHVPVEQPDACATAVLDLWHRLVPAGRRGGDAGTVLS